MAGRTRHDYRAPCCSSRPAVTSESDGHKLFPAILTILCEVLNERDDALPR
jgi:hypothetical protein